MPADNLTREYPPEKVEQHKGAEKEKEDALGSLISLGALLLLMFTALAFGAVESWSISVFGMFVLTLSVLWIAKAVLDKRIIVTIPAALWPLCAFLIYGFLQTVSRFDETGKRFAISLDVEATRLALEVLGILLIAFLIFANFFVSGRRLLWLRSFLILFGLGLAVFGLIQKYTWNGKYYWLVQPSTPPTSPFGSFVNHNHFAGYLEMIAPIPLAMFLVRSVHREISIFYCFAAAMMGIAVFLSLSRGGMLSLLSGFIFVVAFGAKPAIERFRGYEIGSRTPLFLLQMLAVILIVSAIIVGVLWIGGDEIVKRVSQVELSGAVENTGNQDERFLDGRFWIWRDTVEMIRANWQTGVGLGAYETAFPMFTKSNGALIVSQAHNDYLQIVADCGVIGVFLTIWFLVVLFRDINRAMRHRLAVMSGMALGCGGGVVAILVHSLFDFNLQLPSNALLFLVLTAAISNISVAADKTTQAQFE
ncbi:MAG: O-antigen ligase family protein [Acidobacteriota bacterium]|nr:O-antigen ligase family protein [Acidobacteriota bacterium]